LKPLNKEQLIFVVEFAMVSGMDRIESCLPDTITLAGYQQRKHEITAYIHGCVGTVGTNLACLWAQTVGKVVGDGMGIGDALEITGFEKFAEQFVKERTSPDWPGLKEGEPVFPDPRPLAEKFVEEHWGDYFSPFGDTGYELEDGGVIEFPDPNGGEIVRRDQYGNMEEVRQYGDLDWPEWYDLFENDEDRFFTGLTVRLENNDIGVINDTDHDEGKAFVENLTAAVEGWVPYDKLTPITHTAK
jgi:hypothetical protein